ncbi:MAG: hypothetical protein KME29_22425 [Calothrix sp. FI2-JRJ7]|jgi:hypothetical protein|nr:hypothetical protein [Calothrix sp. FI2-JRJ7]
MLIKKVIIGSFALGLLFVGAINITGEHPCHAEERKAELFPKGSILKTPCHAEERKAELFPKGSILKNSNLTKIFRYAQNDNLYFGFLGMLPTTVAQMPHQTHTSETQTSFQRLEQPLWVKAAVTASGFGLIGLEIWWFLLSKPKSKNV